ncbi:MAG: SET domain-containing protein [Candidatus Latescibacterota bacterium]|nr:MAG: SET domain-containing protein [Candidatus Latescibacterota bacterium]
MPTYIKKSRIHGRGLFARLRISRGRFIGTYEGPDASRNSKYVLWVLQHDGTRRGILGRNALRYVNHSSQPNAEFRGADLFAIRIIRPDEEITIDYGPDWADLN